MQAEFKQGYVPEETILELRPDRAVVEKVHAAIVAWVNETYDRVMAAGLCGCPSLGEYCEDYAWADLNSGPVQVNVPEGTIQIVFYNQPEGDDRLDPEHPHWIMAHDHLWMFAVPRVRQLLEGNLK